MGRQYRIPRAGSNNDGRASAHFAVTSPGVVTSSSKLVAVPNYGITDVSAFTAGDYVLDAPFPGAYKVLVSNTSSSTAVVIWGSTDASVAFAAESGGDKKTKISFAASTADTIVQMFGINSTKWYVQTYPAATTIASPVSFTS
jgi:hypothetical protein